MSERRSLWGLDWVAVAAAALASVSSAVILSTLGASGTLIGAAVGSVVATVSSAMYSRGLQTSKDKVSVALKGGGVQEVSREQADRLEAEGVLADSEANDEVLDSGEDATEEDRRTLAERFRAINWRKVAPWTIGTFVVVMVAITAFELIGGKPVSSLTGGSDGDGTSISRLVERNNDRGNDKDKSPSDRQSSPGTNDPSNDPSTDPSQAPTTSLPTTDPTEQPSESPTEAPTTEPTPSDSATPAHPNESPFTEPDAE